MDYHSMYLISAFLFLFLSFEFTLIDKSFKSLSTAKIKTFKDENIKDIEIIENLYEDENVIRATLVADYISNALCAISITMFLYYNFDEIGIIIGLFLSPILIIVFGESAPRTLAAQKYDTIIIKKAKFLHFTNIVMRPIVFLLSGFSKLIVKLSGGDRDFVQPLITEDEFIDAVSLGIEEGILNKSESLIIENIMDFRDSLARDIMTPRIDIIALDINSHYDDIVKVIKEESFSRMPVYDGDIDNIIGTFHVKDLVFVARDGYLKDYINLIKPTFNTYEYKPIAALFAEMRHKKISVSIVRDEYGGTEGMITLEDLIEKIVGSISDEYDEEEDEDIIKIGSKEYLLDGSMNLDELNHYLNINLESEENETIAGYIIENIDRFPTTGEVLNINGFTFIIKKCQKNRIEKLILKL